MCAVLRHATSTWRLFDDCWKDCHNPTQWAAQSTYIIEVCLLASRNFILIHLAVFPPPAAANKSFLFVSQVTLSIFLFIVMDLVVSRHRRYWFVGDFPDSISSNHYFYCSGPSCPFSVLLRPTLVDGKQSYEFVHHVFSQHWTSSRMSRIFPFFPLSSKNRD